jgi:hypothetical protein
VKETAERAEVHPSGDGFASQATRAKTSRLDAAAFVTSARSYLLHVLLFDAPLTFREFMTHEELPLAMAKRGGKEKGLSDRLDVHRLLNAFPELRQDDGGVAQRLQALGADEAVIALLREVVAERIEPDEDEGY